MNAPVIHSVNASEVVARLDTLWLESRDDSLRELGRAIGRDGLESHRDLLCTRLMENYKCTSSGDAYSLLFEVSARPFHTIICSRLRRHYYLLDPHDVLQEVFFNIYRYPYRFKAEKPASFRNWANTIIRNTILKFIRDRSRDASLSFADEEIDSRVDPRQLSPLGEAIRDESSRICGKLYLVYLLLYAGHYNRLSKKERRALHAVEVEGLSYREVSLELGIKLENLKMVIFRARKKILRNLDRSVTALSSPLS
jgi:DNA-directed RNA polymerase specialized sigma24 family protein